jgi:hypothetical protein
MGYPRIKQRKGGGEGRRGRNWMSAMGILFIIMAVIIALRNLFFFTIQYSFNFYIDRYTNGQINNEKFVIAMIIAGGVLLYWGYFRKKEDSGLPDERGRRRFNYGK